jgi:hypothetical protein
MAKVMNAFRYNLLESFRRDVLVGRHYLFLSRGTHVSDSTATAQEILGNMISATRILPDDVRFAVPKFKWERGTVYTQYDSSTDLYGEPFYVVADLTTSEASGCQVFKCISNGGGQPSQVRPVYDALSMTTNGMLYLSDGYVWQYMYAISHLDMLKFSTETHVPVNGVYSPLNGEIQHIEVLNKDENIGYNAATAKIALIDSSSAFETEFALSDTEDFVAVENFYTGFTVQLKSQDGLTIHIYKVRSSGIRSSDSRPFITVSGYTIGSIEHLHRWNVMISPTVDIKGDGLGAIAVPVITNGRVSAIEVLSRGVGYTRAVARVIRPTQGFFPDDQTVGTVPAVLRVVQPVGLNNGGRIDDRDDIIAMAAELYANMIVIAKNLDDISAGFSSSAVYDKIGLVRAPKFEADATPDEVDNRIRIEVVDVSHVTAGQPIKQVDSGFRGVVDEVVESLNVIYVRDFVGPTSGIIADDDDIIGLSPHLDINERLVTNTGVLEISGSVTLPKYQQFSGEVLYVRSTDPIDRTDDLKEHFKFTVEL